MRSSNCATDKTGLAKQAPLVLLRCTSSNYWRPQRIARERYSGHHLSGIPKHLTQRLSRSSDVASFERRFVPPSTTAAERRHQSRKAHTRPLFNARGIDHIPQSLATDATVRVTILSILYGFIRISQVSQIFTIYLSGEINKASLSTKDTCVELYLFSSR